MKFQLALACIAAFALCVSSHPNRNRRDVSSDLDAAGDIADKEQTNVADMIQDVVGDGTATDKLLADLKSAGNDQAKIKAALTDGEDVVDREDDQIDRFEDNWDADEGAGANLKKDVEAGNLPADDVPYAKKVVGVQEEADADIAALASAFDALRARASQLYDRLKSGNTNGAQLLEDADTLQQQEENGGKQFVDAMDEVQDQGDALAKDA